MPKITVRHPKSGKTQEIQVPGGATYGAVLEEAGLARPFYAVREDGVLKGFYETARDGAEVEPVGFDDPEGRDLYRHSSAHIMASAVAELFPSVKYAIGPAIEDGFFYDFRTEEPFTEDDLR